MDYSLEQKVTDVQSDGGACQGHMAGKTGSIYNLIMYRHPAADRKCCDCQTSKTEPWLPLREGVHQFTECHGGVSRQESFYHINMI